MYGSKAEARVKGGNVVVGIVGGEFGGDADGGLGGGADGGGRGLNMEGATNSYS